MQRTRQGRRSAILLYNQPDSNTTNRRIRPSKTLTIGRIDPVNTLSKILLFYLYFESIVYALIKFIFYKQILTYFSKLLPIPVILRQDNNYGDRRPDGWPTQMFMKNATNHICNIATLTICFFVHKNKYFFYHLHYFKYFLLFLYKDLLIHFCVMLTNLVFLYLYIL